MRGMTTITLTQPSSRAAVGTLMAGTATITVGFSVAVSALLTTAPVLATQAARYLIGAVALLAVARVRRLPLPRPTRREAGRILLLAATGCAGFNLCLVAALRHAEPGAVGVVLGCVPLALAVAGPLLARRRPGGRVLVAAALAVAGAAVVEGGGTMAPLGFALALGALAGECAFSILAVPLLPRLGALAVSLYSCAATAVMLAAASPLADGVAALRAPSTSEGAAIVFLGLAVTAGSFLAWYGGIARLGIERAGLFAGLFPVAALLGGVALGRGAIGPAEAAGTVLVLAGLGVGLVSRGHRRDTIA
jgi:drug/metabolite transporter (DMT)-like permease